MEGFLQVSLCFYLFFSYKIQTFRIFPLIEGLSLIWCCQVHHLQIQFGKDATRCGSSHCIYGCTCLRMYSTIGAVGDWDLFFTRGTYHTIMSKITMSLWKMVKIDLGIVYQLRLDVKVERSFLRDKKASIY